MVIRRHDLIVNCEFFFFHQKRLKWILLEKLEFIQYSILMAGLFWKRDKITRSRERESTIGDFIENTIQTNKINRL